MFLIPRIAFGRPGTAACSAQPTRPYLGCDQQSAAVYKAYKPEADATAEIAVDLRQGKDIKSVADTTATSGSGDSVPAKLLTAVSVTKADIKNAIGTDALYPTAQLCNGPFTQPCKHAGIQ
jgi:D-xylose transport system substrate-binding protein